MAGMFSYPKAAMERAMKVQEVILRAMAKQITWWQAAEIIGISDRHMRRWRERYEEFGFRALFDRRRGEPFSQKGAPAGGGRRVGGFIGAELPLYPPAVLPRKIEQHPIKPDER